MVVSSLLLEDYRNYNKLEVKFSPGINFICGGNGQGKTNLIESLYFLTHLKSFRVSKTAELCSHNKSSSAIEALFSKRGVSNSVKINISKNLKQVMLNRKTVNYRSEYIKLFFSILFAPDQLEIFRLHPREKRNFFDRVLVLTDAQYFQIIKKFNKIKEQKGHLLRRKELNDILIWNRLLARIIPLIVKTREGLVNDVNAHISEIFSSLTGRGEKLKLRYQNSFEGRAEMKEGDVLSFLSDKAEAESEKGYLCYGPHKDGFWMTLDGKKDRLTLSRGEYRASFLALQLSVNRIVSESLDFHPLLLLDDIFSELDEDVHVKTLNYISGIKNQVFVTSAKLPPAIPDQASFLFITNGKITSQKSIQ